MADRPDNTKTNGSTEKDAVNDLLGRLERAIPQLAKFDTALAERATRLTTQGAELERRSQGGFRHELAYAFEDLEKTAIGRRDLSASTRSEMTRLAGSAPGLENERMLAIMKLTPTLEDRSMVKAVRETGAAIGRETDQNGSGPQSRIDALEARLRIMERRVEGPITTTGRPPEPPNEPPRKPPSQDRPPQQDGHTRSGAAPDGTARREPGNGGTQQQVLVARSPIDTLFSAFRHGDKGPGAPWDPPPTPMKDRVTAFERTMQAGADDRVLQKAEKSGRAALDALQSFGNGEGAAVMSRIQAAAQADPGGMASVLSEMKEGGRYSELRGQFNNTLLNEKGAGAAYDKAAAAVAKYAQDRPGVEQVIGRRADATNIANKFEQMDDAIGEASGKTPSRKDGKSMLEDMAKIAREFIQNAMVAVKSAFTRTPSADAGMSKPPSPSPN